MNFLKELLNVFFPDLCLICDNNLTFNEETLCTFCRVDLPFTNFSSESNNVAERTFYGRIKLEAVTSLLFYRKKGKTQQLIHQLKYKNQQKIGALTALMLAEELKNNPRFNDLDGVIIVPMHPKKERKRGYNQVTVFGKTLAKELKIPFIENILVKTSATTSQTFKSRLQRFQDFEGKFHLNNLTSLENKHILLVDDVITTGATIESCAIELFKTKNIKISIATIAYTD
ncbi:MAG: ComF family protein [Flavobacteriaceae bacterium]|nr:ComF family protein [Flavobacteriaceae bacterium]